MGTIFSSATITDEHVMEQLQRNFSFLTGESRPKVKPSSKNDPSITKEQWFREMSWLNMFTFFQAFHEATARDILNVAEKAMCQEIIDMIDKGYGNA